MYIQFPNQSRIEEIVGEQALKDFDVTVKLDSRGAEFSLAKVHKGTIFTKGFRVTWIELDSFSENVKDLSASCVKAINNKIAECVLNQDK